MFILGITGNKRAGKDSVCKIVQEYFANDKVLRIAFADALKEEVAQAIGQTVPFIDVHKDHFRLILQGWGTNFRRQLCGEDYWLVRWQQKVYRTLALGIIVPDIRFLNEAECIHELGGIIWRVVRPTPGSMVDRHESETELQRIRADVTFVNDGSLEDLAFKVTTLLKQWRNYVPTTKRNPVVE